MKKISFDLNIERDNPCLASKPFLQKPVNYYDDWAYIGKERYGSRKASRRLPTLGIKYFDALGRIYEEIMGRKMYYTKEPLVEMFDIPLEFEVYARIVKDSEGNDIQVFIKEDKKNRLRRDSSFYWDGYWEVMEKDDVAKTIKSKTSLGIKTITEYNATWHINKYYLIDKNNDTTITEQYIWQNGRLVKMTQNGLERVYIYGKTLRDSVKVIPSDENLYFHPGYNNSVGMIPDENDPMYEYFAKDPYSGVYISNKNKLFLGRLSSYQYPIVELDVPIPDFINPSRETCKLPICPKNDDISGFVQFGYLLLNENGTNMWSSCVMDINFCNYRISYGIKVDILRFEILQSILKYNINEKKYDRWCRTERELQDTYNHERQHILNAMEYANEIVNEYMPVKFYYSKNECNLFKKEAEDIIFEKFGIWKRKEAEHSNPNSPPKSTGPKNGELCDVE